MKYIKDNIKYIDKNNQFNYFRDIKGYSLKDKCYILNVAIDYFELEAILPEMINYGCYRESIVIKFINKYKVISKDRLRDISFRNEKGRIKNPVRDLFHKIINIHSNESFLKKIIPLYEEENKGRDFQLLGDLIHRVALRIYNKNKKIISNKNYYFIDYVQKLPNNVRKLLSMIPFEYKYEELKNIPWDNRFSSIDVVNCSEDNLKKIINKYPLAIQSQLEHLYIDSIEKADYLIKAFPNNFDNIISARNNNQRYYLLKKYKIKPTIETFIKSKELQYSYQSYSKGLPHLKISFIEEFISDEIFRFTGSNRNNHYLFEEFFSMSFEDYCLKYFKCKGKKLKNVVRKKVLIRYDFRKMYNFKEISKRYHKRIKKEALQTDIRLDMLLWIIIAAEKGVDYNTCIDILYKAPSVDKKNRHIRDCWKTALEASLFLNKKNTIKQMQFLCELVENNVYYDRSQIREYLDTTSMLKKLQYSPYNLNFSSLKELHDKVMYIYRREKTKPVEFHQNIELPDTISNYEVFIPQNQESLYSIGEELNNCVLSYAKRIQKGLCNIISLKKDNNHHICIELVGELIVQAKLKNNQSLKVGEIRNIQDELNKYLLSNKKTIYKKYEG